MTETHWTRQQSTNAAKQNNLMLKEKNTHFSQAG